MTYFVDLEDDDETHDLDTDEGHFVWVDEAPDCPDCGEPLLAPDGKRASVEWMGSDDPHIVCPEGCGFEAPILDDHDEPEDE